MKSRDDLFQLIKSLSAAEKRNFKLYNDKNAAPGNGNYELLFNLIEQQTIYDEKKVVKQLGNRNMTKQLSVSKHYLYNHILKSLETFQYQKNADKKLNSYLDQIAILHERSLARQCKEIIERAKKMALEFEDFKNLLKILDWERILLTEIVHDEYINEKLLKNQELYRFAINQIATNNELAYLDSQMIILIKKRGIIRSAEDEQYFENIVQQPILQQPEKFELFKQLYYYHHIFSLYYFVKDKKTESFKHREALLKLYNSHPKFIEENRKGYITALNNYILVCQQTNKENEFYWALEIIKKLKPATKEEQKNIAINITTQELLYYYYSGNYTKATALSKDIEALLQQYNNNLNLSNIILFYFILGCSYLKTKSHDRAIYYINLLLNLPGAESVEDLFRFTRIIQLIIHYELGNYRLIESLSNSTERMLKNDKKLYGIEVVILELFTSIAQKNGEDKNNDLLKAAYTKIKEQLKNPFENRTLAYFNFTEWFEDKLNNK
jgi:hypothetical protein